MNPKPIIRRLVCTVLASGLVLATVSASADRGRHHNHWRHYHYNDVAEGLLVGALAALTIGIIFDGIDGRHAHKRRHAHRPDPYAPGWRYRHAPRYHDRGHRHRKWHRHGYHHRNGYHHRPHRVTHWRTDRGRGHARPSRDRRDWRRVH